MTSERQSPEPALASAFRLGRLRRIGWIWKQAASIRPTSPLCSRPRVRQD
ncbi:hypothetical protein [Streptomyces sp. NPDC048527]